VSLPPGWVVAQAGDVVDVLDHLRVPVNKTERAARHGDVPYYGATGQVGWIDEPLFDEELCLLGEDGAPFLESSRPKAYVIDGPSWVNNHAHVLRPCQQVIDARFLKYALDQADYRPYVTGTTRLKLTKSAMTQIRLPIPPLPEQRRIAAAIEELLSRLDAATNTFRVLRIRLSALERSALTRALAEGEERRLGDLLDGIEAGRSFGGAGGPAGPEEWGVIRVSAMTWGDFKSDENKMVPAEFADPRWEIHQGDLLLSRANTTDYVGAAVLVRETRPRLLLSDKSLRLVVKPDVDKSWLLRALSAPHSRRQISAVATGTSDSMRNVSQEKLRAITLRVPRSDRQAAIARQVESELQRIVDLRRALNVAERRAHGLRRAILASAFGGLLVPQDPDDEPASVLLERIAAERAAASKPARKPWESAPA
jgi:type I restriction enzyme S subunit